MTVDPNTWYTVNVYDGFGDSVQAGIVLGANVDELLPFIDASEPWAPCRNDCCLNRDGIGQWAGYVIKLTPNDKSVRDYLLEWGDNAVTHNAEVQTTLDAIDNASAGLDRAFRTAFDSSADGESN